MKATFLVNNIDHVEPALVSFLTLQKKEGDTLVNFCGNVGKLEKF